MSVNYSAASAFLGSTQRQNNGGGLAHVASVVGHLITHHHDDERWVKKKLLTEDLYHSRREQEYARRREDRRDARAVAAEHRDSMALKRRARQVQWMHEDADFGEKIADKRHVGQLRRDTERRAWSRGQAAQDHEVEARGKGMIEQARAAGKVAGQQGITPFTKPKATSDPTVPSSPTSAPKAAAPSAPAPSTPAPGVPASKASPSSPGTPVPSAGPMPFRKATKDPTVPTPPAPASPAPRTSNVPASAPAVPTTNPRGDEDLRAVIRQSGVNPRGEGIDAVGFGEPDRLRHTGRAGVRALEAINSVATKITGKAPEPPERSTPAEIEQKLGDHDFAPGTVLRRDTSTGKLHKATDRPGAVPVYPKADPTHKVVPPFKPQPANRESKEMSPDTAQRLQQITSPVRVGNDAQPFIRVGKPMRESNVPPMNTQAKAVESPKPAALAGGKGYGQPFLPTASNPVSGNPLFTARHALVGDDVPLHPQSKAMAPRRVSNVPRIKSDV